MVGKEKVRSMFIWPRLYEGPFVAVDLNQLFSKDGEICKVILFTRAEKDTAKELPAEHLDFYNSKVP